MYDFAFRPNESRRPSARTSAALRCAALLFVMLSASFVAAAQARSDNDADNIQRLRQAAAAISNGQLPQAEALLDALLSSSPRDADALNLLGVVRAQQRREGDAENFFRRALGASPSHIGARVNLAELYIATGRPAQALPLLLAAHRLAPKRPDVNLKLAALYQSRRECVPALQHLRLVPRPDADAEYFPLQLKCLLILKRLEDARRLAAEFKASDAGDAEARADFALLLASGNLGEEARDLLDSTLAREPGSFPALYAQGIINAAAKRYEKAQEFLNAALRAKPDDVPTLRALARVERSTGNPEKALALLLQARRIAPDAAGVLYDFGATAMELDLYLDALPAFEQLHRAQPREPAYLYALAAAQFRSGEQAKVVSLLKRYIAQRSSDAAGFYLMGAALNTLKQFADARVALERSLKLRADPDAEYLLGLNFYDEGNRAAAIETLQRVVRARPDHAGAHTALGSAYREQGDFARARVTLERAVKLNPKDLRAHYQLGLVYGKLGDREAARRMLDRAEQLRGEQREQEKIVLKLADPPDGDRTTGTPPR